jgi:hypothetical protein
VPKPKNLNPKFSNLRTFSTSTTPPPCASAARSIQKSAGPFRPLSTTEAMIGFLQAINGCQNPFVVERERARPPRPMRGDSGGAAIVSNHIKSSLHSGNRQQRICRNSTRSESEESPKSHCQYFSINPKPVKIATGDDAYILYNISCLLP